MTIKIIVSNKIINELCNFQVIFTDISNINLFKNTAESNKIILKNVINCTHIKDGLPPNIDIKHPFASEYYTVKGYKITLLYLNSNCLDKQNLFIEEELNKESDYYILFIDKPISFKTPPLFNKNKLLVITLIDDITNKYNTISLNNNDYIFLEIGDKIKYYYRNNNKYKIKYN